MFLLGVGFRILQDQFPFAPHRAADLDDAVDLRDLGRVFRAARFEQFCHARQTTRDVLGLGNFARRLGEQSAGANLVVRLDDNVRAGWNGVARGHFAVVTHDHDLRMQVFLVLDDDRAHQAGRFVDVALHRHARDHVAEFDLAAFVGQDRNVVRIPLHESLALLHRPAVGFGNDRTDDNVVALDFAAFFVVQADRAVFVERNPVAVEGLHRAQIIELHDAVVLRLDDRLFERLARGAADVERPHRQLRAGFADRLRGNDADGFAEFHELPGGEVASVTMRANAAACFAGEDGTNLETLDPDLFDRG